MPVDPLFKGLIVDEFDKPVDTAFVGEEAFYVVDDDGFRRHVPSEDVDRQVLAEMTAMVEGHEDELSEQAAKMMGMDDIFSKAMLENQFKNLDQQMEQALKTGIPEEGRAYLGMAGLRIRINHHGDLLEVEQPGMIAPEDE